jgi:hypothetical protein
VTLRLPPLNTTWPVPLPMVASASMDNSPPLTVVVPE